MFKFYNIHPSDDGAEFQFQGNASGGSGYNETITSTHFDAYHGEDAGSATLSYMTGFDQAQGTSFDTLSRDIGNDNDYYKFEKDITNIHNQLKTINTKLDNLISIIKSQID